MDSLKKIRVAQLDHEENIDMRLQSLPCSNLVNTYLFFCRSSNRYNTREIANQSWNIFGIYEKMKEELHRKDTIQADIELILNSSDPCSQLKLYLSRN